MTALILSFVVIGTAVAAMSLGSMLGRAPIKGSCGGLACIKSLKCDGCPHQAAGGDTP